MFENVDGRTDVLVTGLILAHSTGNNSKISKAELSFLCMTQSHCALEVL